MNKKVKVITSNCGCFYTDLPSAFASLFNYKALLTDQDVSFIKLPHFRLKKDSKVGYLLRTAYRSVSEPLRGYQYAKLTTGYDIVHFHQSADAFGYDSLKWLLRFARKEKVIVTIYGLSPIQKEHPELCRIYNKADGVIVSTDYMKNTLSGCGVDENKIHVVPYGATLKAVQDVQRDGAIMFAGSPLINVKGFTYLASALRILKDEGRPLRLKMHGYYMPGHQEWAIEVAKKEGIDDLITWLSFNSLDELIDAYQSSMCCVIPYTDYPGCFPVTVAMANAVPVVASNAMGLPEYVHGGGIVAKSGSVEELADALRNLLEDESLRTKMGQEGRAIAEKRYAWDTLADQTLTIYEDILGTTR